MLSELMQFLHSFSLVLRLAPRLQPFCSDIKSETVPKRLQKPFRNSSARFLKHGVSPKKERTCVVFAGFDGATGMVPDLASGELRQSTFRFARWAKRKKQK
ncbi:hypothetical protein A2661_02340 [Candidatus Giovannonibacteria bacterium RIFCSPHIGHO2_01_FULL_45_24]|uniref:Uncharacterized protein n=1 Tax=Candidatus Giovannonibacteria bacterium RIFCSPLOWO2_01_FULL_46_32 TaxID=1798353 RepID=A0A1F5XHX2_9BACT|nr:MAG: hypothetical protein A2661_02340 [Candidatus Giovannonibacteria bacterium RIFCSPHIGHO2_01_FULL_45_24]OGF87535.1 MAG: hypothetical protein A3B19_03065 [Candidatus Giovannonibacteria bacterium RIFCSPLOWO2_01_FULL_46_32]